MISPFYPSNDPKAFISIWVVRGVGVSAFNKALHSEPQVEDMNPELVRLNQSEMPPLVPFWSGNRVKQSEQSSGPQVAEAITTGIQSNHNTHSNFRCCLSDHFIFTNRNLPPWLVLGAKINK